MRDSNDSMDILDMSSSRGRLTADVSYLMLKGAGYAALVFFGIWILIAAMAYVGRLLPDEAREAADPSPWSSLDVTAIQTTDLV